MAIEFPHRDEAQLSEFLQTVHDGQGAGGIQTCRDQHGAVRRIRRGDGENLVTW